MGENVQWTFINWVISEVNLGKLMPTLGNLEKLSWNKANLYKSGIHI